MRPPPNTADIRLNRTRTGIYYKVIGTTAQGRKKKWYFGTDLSRAQQMAFVKVTQYYLLTETLKYRSKARLANTRIWIGNLPVKRADIAWSNKRIKKFLMDAVERFELFLSDAQEHHRIMAGYNIPPRLRRRIELLLTCISEVLNAKVNLVTSTDYVPQQLIDADMNILARQASRRTHTNRTPNTEPGTGRASRSISI